MTGVNVNCLQTTLMLDRMAALESALDGLLDGLDANADPERCGLDATQWQRRITTARALLEKTTEAELAEVRR